MPSRDLSLGVLFSAKMDATFASIASKFKDAFKDIETSINKVTKATEQSGRGFISYNWKIKDIIADMEKLLAIQARWYGAKFALFAGVEVPITLLKEGIKYIIEIDKATAKLDRYALMEGKMGEEAKKTSKDIVELSRTISVHMGVLFEDIIKSADRLAAAGLGIDTVKASLQDFAKLQLAFPEIEMEKFTTAIVGFLNSFKESPSLEKFATDSEKISAILDKAVVALGKSVLDPKNLTMVIQYLGQVGSVTGFSVDELLAMAAMLTNLGAKANTASRSLRGFLLSLTTKSAREQLEALGITLDQTKTIAQQFDNIMVGLRKAVGTGELTVGSLGALTKITSTERLGALLALIKQWEGYKDMVESIQGSEGALDRVAQRMNDTLSAKIQILKNIKRELGAAATESGNFGKVLEWLTEGVRYLALWINGLATAVGIVVSAMNLWISVAKIWYGSLWDAITGKGREQESSNPFSGIFGFVKSLWQSRDKVKEAGGAFSNEFNKIMEDANRFHDRMMKVPKDLRGTDVKSMLGIKGKDENLPTPGSTETEKEKYKGWLNDRRAAEKSYFDAKLSEIRNNYATEDKLLEASFKNKLISEEEYREKKKELREKDQGTFQEEIYADMLALTETYNEQYAQINKIGNAQERQRRTKVTAAKEKADFAKIITRLTQEENKLKIDSNEDYLRERISQMRRELNQALYNSEMEKKAIQQTLELRSKGIEEEERLNEFRFGKGEISSTEYYQRQIDLEKELLKVKIESADKARQADFKANLARANNGIITQEEYEKIKEEDSKNYQDYVNKKEVLEQDSAYKILEIYRKLSEDLEIIYKEGGWVEVVKKTLDKVYNEYKKTGEKIADLVKGIISSMESSLSDTYSSILKGKFNVNKEGDLSNIDEQMRTLDIRKQDIDLQIEQVRANERLTESQKESQIASLEAQKEQLEAQKSALETNRKAIEETSSLKEAFQSFLDAVLEQIAKFLASQTVNYFLNFMKTAFSSYDTGGSGGGGGGGEGVWVHSGGVIGRDNLVHGYISDIPKYHSGVGPGEHLAVLRNDEGVFTPGQMAALGDRERSINVSINLENKSSQEVKAKSSGTMFDGKKYIISVILEDINKGGLLRNALL